MQASTPATAATAPDAQAALAANEFFRSNLAAIKRWAPHLYRQLSAITAPYTDLIVDPDGTIDIGFRGQRLYGEDAVAYANARIEDFAKAPTREYINEPDPAKMKGMTGDFCEALREGMRGAGITYKPDQRFPDSHFLLNFGVGLGLHLKAMVERTGAKVAVLIEPNIEYLYHSLFVTDWAELFEFGERRGVRFSLVVSQKPAEIAAKTGQVLRGNNPSLLDGVSLFSGYRSIILDRAKELVRQDLFLSLSGLGYFEDEVIMCRNAVGNLAAGAGPILGQGLPARDEPLFLVGSGPSVESDLDFIAAQSGRAVLLSIGTGLRTVLAHGIRPDFHLELENGPGTPEVVAATARDFDIGGVTLVASATVNPSLPGLFDATTLFFRERVVPTQIFGGPFQIVQPAGPTVANAALVSAIRLGFREIYLFGVDMGSKAEGRFHAKGSVYGAGQREEKITATRLFPGNFGGTATGTHVFDWSRKVIENTLQHYRSVRVYNCSDGVRIEGAIPKVSRAVSLPARPVDRAALMREITKGLVRAKPEIWSDMWRQAAVRAQGEAIFDRIESVLAELRADRDSRADWLQGLCDVMASMAQQSPVVATLLSGSLQLAVGCASWYERRLVDSGQRAAYRRMAAEELVAMTGRLRAGLDDLTTEIEATLDVAAPTDRAADP